MKVALVAKNNKWGIGEHIRQLIKAFPEIGFEEHYGGKGDLRNSRLTRKLKGDFDLIHVHGSPLGAFGNPQKPIVTTVHSLLSYEWKHVKSLRYLLGQLFEKSTFAKSRKIIAVNQILIDELKENYGVDKDKLVFIPNCIDVSEFNHREIERKHFVMGAGRNVRIKDFKTLIEGCKLAGVEYKLLHQASRSTVLTTYREASIFISSSLYEGLPMTVLEAMASKCPVICSNIPALHTLVIDGKTGLFFEPTNAEDLAEKIRCLLNDSKLRRTLADNAYKHLLTNFTYQRYSKVLISIYEEAINA